MKSLSTTLFTLTAMTLMIMTVSSSGFRGLQDVSLENTPSGTPSIKISGVAQLIQAIIDASNFTNAPFDVITLDTLSQSVTEQGINYEGKLSLVNGEGIDISSLINGAWDKATNKLVLTASKYEVVPEEITPVVPEGYTYISPEDLANNAQAQEALAWGVNALIQKGISQYKIPAASPEYNVTNLIMAAYKNQPFGATYLFQINLANALNYKVDANITVSYRTAINGFLLPAYKFNSYNYPKSAIVIPPPQNTTNNTTNNTVPDNSTIVVDNSTVIVDNNTTVVDNSTVVPPVNVTEPVANNTNVTVPVTPTVPEGFTLITADQLAQDSVAQAALQSGINALIQKAISQNKIPAANPTYTVANLIVASYKKQAIGTTYKFQVNLTNVDKVKVDANLNVMYKYASKDYSLNGYSFRSYNYSNKALAKNSDPAGPVANNTPSATNTTTLVVADTPVVDNTTVVDVNAAPVAGNTGSR